MAKVGGKGSGTAEEPRALGIGNDASELDRALAFWLSAASGPRQVVTAERRPRSPAVDCLKAFKKFGRSLATPLADYCNSTARLAFTWQQFCAGLDVEIGHGRKDNCCGHDRVCDCAGFVAHKKA
jgi:hypothetical protein